MVYLKVMLTHHLKNNRAAAIGAILGGAGGLYLDNKEKKIT